FMGVISALAGAEIWVNFASFQNIGAGGNGLSNLIIGFFCAVGQAGSAKELGIALCKKLRRRMWVFLSFTAMLCVGVSISRLLMDDTSVIERVFFFAVNIGAAIATVLLAYFHAKHHDFFALQQDRKKFAEKRDRINHQIEYLEEADRKRRKAIEEHFDHLARLLEHSYQTQLKSRVEHYETCLKRLESHEHLALGTIEASMQHALGEYRRLNQEARHRHHLPSVKRWHLPPSGNDSDGSLSRVAAILLLLMVSLIGCSNPMTETHIEVLVDKTDSVHVQEVEPMLDYIQGFVITDTLQTEWGETTVNLSPIGETSTQPVITVHLPASGSVWFRNEKEHKKQLGKFRAELRQA
ncbi:MAG: hypothetical protein ABL962_22160, partial [Fimbriimonadaceae bacterium]